MICWPSHRVCWRAANQRRWPTNRRGPRCGCANIPHGDRMWSISAPIRWTRMRQWKIGLPSAIVNVPRPPPAWMTKARDRIRYSTSFSIWQRRLAIRHIRNGNCKPNKVKSVWSIWLAANVYVRVRVVNGCAKVSALTKVFLHWARSLPPWPIRRKRPAVLCHTENPCSPGCWG